MKYTVVFKCLKLVKVYVDQTSVAEDLGLSRSVVRGMLPYYENADYIFASCEVIKSKRGRNSFIK